jgi:hypothetical protein
MKYTYSDEEDDIYSDSTNNRRSTRNTGTHTPAEQSGPTITQSGRQVKSRQGGAYGESILSETHGPAISTGGGFDGTSEEPEAMDPAEDQEELQRLLLPMAGPPKEVAILKDTTMLMR